MNKIQEIAQKIGLKIHVLEEIEELLLHDEWGMAYETLCSEIQEEKLQVSRDIYSQIVYIGKDLEIDPWYWEEIKKYQSKNFD